MSTMVAKVLCCLVILFLVNVTVGRKNNTSLTSQKDICHMEVMECKTWFLQWYYKPDIGKCVIVYSGCNGNPNMFRDEETCMQRCAKHRPRRKRLNGPNDKRKQHPDQSYQRPDHSNQHSDDIYQRPILPHRRSDQSNQLPKHSNKHSDDIYQRPIHPHRRSDQSNQLPKHSDDIYQRPILPHRRSDQSYERPVYSHQRPGVSYRPKNKTRGFHSSQNMNSKHIKNICAMQIERCKTHYPRWYYNPASGTCSLETDGCNDNVNSFPTEKSCRKRCIPRVTATQQARQVPRI